MKKLPKEYRVLGKTGLKVSPLALGTVELGIDYGINMPGHFGRPTESEGVALIHAALEAGINHIDTARAYGTSETVVGKALQGRRADVVLATKAHPKRIDGSIPTGSTLKRHLLEQLDRSLAELQTDYVDIWSLHSVSEVLLAQPDLLEEIFHVAKHSGKVRWIGGTFYGISLPIRALETGLFDVFQVAYSVFDQRLADDFFPLAAAQNVGVVVRSILLKGVLTERAEHLPDRLSELRAQSRKYRRLVADSTPDLSPAQIAVAFGLAHPQIGSVLTGVRTIDELQENCRAADVMLPPALLRQLHDLRLVDDQLLDPQTWGLP